MPDILTQVPPLGAHPGPEGTLFRAWSTKARAIDVLLEGARHPLTPKGSGLFEALVPGVGVGERYKLALDGEPWPDPYARFLPDGVHGAAEVWAPGYAWKHAAPSLAPHERVFYELHVGTFTPEGTYAAAAAKLPHLVELGVTCLELLPLSAFPGRWGWGYDGVAAFAPFAPYGRPEELMALIDTAHGLGLQVWLDAVYNHFGPDGNYLWVYSSDYFTSEFKTPWGDALDYTHPYMRRLAVDAASHWLEVYRFDGLRLDATHAIVDPSPTHVLAVLAEHAHALSPARALIAEDDRNDPALVTELGLDGVWADDFHHMVHVLLTGEQDGYYKAYEPAVAELARTIDRGWLYEGQTYPPSGEPRGLPAPELESWRFVYCLQNHDQVGNRALGERLGQLISTDAYVAASALLLFLPATPLLFMGQEWGASTPFCYFSDHAGELGQAVSEGRKAEFAHFAAFAEGHASIPDPQALSTFEASKLNWDERQSAPHNRVLAAYRQLLALRREGRFLVDAPRERWRAGALGSVLWVLVRHGERAALLLFNFGDAREVEAIRVGGFERTGVLFESVAGAGATLTRHAAVILEGRSA